MERLTYDFSFNGIHSKQVKGADNFLCKDVCELNDGCEKCPISAAFDRLAAIEDILGDNYDLDRLKELVEADREGRCIVLNSGYTETVGGEALRKAMYECFMTNNEVTRYTADAIAEKIVREEESSKSDEREEKQ